VYSATPLKYNKNFSDSIKGFRISKYFYE